MPTTVVTPDVDRIIKSHETKPNIPIIYNPDTGYYELVISVGGGLQGVGTYVWNPGSGTWERATQAGTVSPPSGSTRSSVVAAAADTLILAANTARDGATVYNEADTNLYLALGGTAATIADYTLQMVPGSYYEVPFGYAGEIRGIWAGAPTGAARVTEIT